MVATKSRDSVFIIMWCTELSELSYWKCYRMENEMGKDPRSWKIGTASLFIYSVAGRLFSLC